MKLALISARPHIRDKAKNLAIMEKYIDKTKADLYIFGEFFLQGDRCRDELRDLSEPVDGPSIDAMKAIAKKKHCHVVFGMPLQDETVNGLLYNTAAFVHPDGTADFYKKWFLPTSGPFEEKIFFDQGEHLPVFQTDLGKVGLLICYDLNFPELSRALALQGADLLVCISASPSTTRKYFERLLPARALENTVFFAFVNLVGSQDDLVYWGGSQAYDPLGNLLVRGPYFKESIVTCDINLHDLEPARANRPVLRDVRPEIYQDLYDFSRFHRKKEK